MPRDQPVNRVFANTGKAIAAHVRTLTPQPTRFDRYSDSLQNVTDGSELLTQAEKRGLRLFVGKARCVNCHNGPLLTNGEFHHSGTPETTNPDDGRGAALKSQEITEFGFFGESSDAAPAVAGDSIRYLERRKNRQWGHG